MTLWSDISAVIQDIILGFVGEYDWRSKHLMIVAKSWWKNSKGGIRYPKVGTIVLEPMRIGREHYEPTFGKTFAAVVSLLTHSQVHTISPDQYKYVERPTDIRSFEPIRDQARGLLLQQMRNLVQAANGQRLNYKNVTTLDLTDNSNSDVADTEWQSEEMAEINLFDPQIPLLPTNGASFAAYLFLWFFPKLTSVNLSRTEWSDSAARSINFAQIKQLIWRYSYITTTSFLSTLFHSTNLIELQLDNSTFRLPYTERTQPWYWREIGEDGDFPYNIFDNLDHCTQLKKFSCSNCRVQWYRGRNIIPLDLLLGGRDNFPINLPHTQLVPGHFCSQWLIRKAPLSLLFFNGPLYERDVERVLTKYHVDNFHKNRPLFQLVGTPMDDDDYYDVDYYNFDDHLD